MQAPPNIILVSGLEFNVVHYMRAVWSLTLAVAGAGTKETGRHIQALDLYVVWSLTPATTGTG